MARISDFERMEGKRLQAHKTEVQCKYALVGDGLIQLNTYGSKDREFPGKLSQTIQLDKERAETLIQILRREFNLS